VINEPGSVTDLPDPGNLPLLAKYHKWIAYQLQNGGNDFTEPNIRAARNAGLSPEGWGVTYAPDDDNNNPRHLSFYDQNMLLGVRAVQVGVEELQVDIEHAAVGTRTGQRLNVIIQALRAAGWTKPVHINTMGAPDSPETSDYEIDLKSFLDTGGGLFSQDYWNESDSFAPRLGVDYWVKRMGVPPSKYNSMIGLHTSGSDKRKPNLRVSGPLWKPLLSDAGIERNYSVFMSQHCDEVDLSALASPAPTPMTNQPNLDDVLHICESYFDQWIRVQGLRWQQIDGREAYGSRKVGVPTRYYEIASIIKPDLYKPHYHTFASKSVKAPV
jgi:hypothetical protein